MIDKFAALKREQYKKQLVGAYEDYKDGRPSAIYNEVYSFAQMKLNRLEVDSGFSKIGSIQTMDDYAQEITIGVFKGLETFKGDGNTFYSWVHKICFNKRKDFERELIGQRNNKVKLMIPVSEEDGGDGGEERDNPEMFHTGGYDGFGIGIPSSVQGIDRKICLEILAGFSYKDIAEEFHMTVKAIERRIAKMRKRLVAERSEERAASLAHWSKANRTNKRPK